MELTLWNKCVFEFLGTMIMILLGDGVCAAVTLEKSKAKGAGWVVITLAWGFAVMCGVFIAGPYSGAHLNPAVTLGFALAGKFAWSAVLPYAAAQMVGGFFGALLVYCFYRNHYEASTDNPEGILTTFCTMPAIPNKFTNVFCEVIATFVLLLIILALSTRGNAPEVGLGSVGGFPVTALIMSLGMSLGGTTGYAINPARDFGPRCVHALIPLKGKRDSGWSYSWVPILGPLTGAAVAACVFLLVY
jgi:glycerol uptake facilitator protein